ncbi:chromosome condensation complex Condensin, subunit G [Dispira simplex]|nr:chromosome condensation complex Condensin, subunit G [Dispira simplex]
MARSRLGNKSQSNNHEVLSTLATVIPNIFNDSQRSGTQHRRNAIALRKLQERCGSLAAEDVAQYMAQRSEGCPLVCASSQFPGESIFNHELVRNLNKVLPVKRRESCAELVMRFVANFVQYGHDVDLKQATERTEDEDEEDTLTSRFIEFLMHHLLKGFNAKDKAVRQRVCQLVALCVNSLGEIDEELYQELKVRLFERIHDKEPAIRVQAVVALCRLQNGEEETSNGQLDNVTKTLLNILRYDPSAEVRRAVLVSIVKSPLTLPRILERSRDLDTVNRRFVYLKVMKEIGDFRILSIDAREKLLSHGIQDREASVKQACVRMLAEHWLGYTNNNLVELLERLDVVNSTVADTALKTLYRSHPEIPGAFSFTEEVWENLTPETAFLIRTTLEFFQESSAEEELYSALPDAPKLAAYIKRFIHTLETAEDEETETNCIFIIHQLLLIANICDFADELGRREFFNLLREMLLLPEIPENQMEIIIDILLKISVNERDFTRIIVETISEIRSSADDEREDVDIDNDAQGMEQQLELVLVKVKCLILTKLLLERCQESLRDNNTLFGLLNEYIIPAIQDTEAFVQELGIVCLSHCCYLDKSLAEENAAAFMQAVRKGEGDIRERALMALADLALMYHIPTLSRKLDREDEIEKVLHECLESSESNIQAIATEGIVRLLYCGKLSHPVTTLETLLILYFHPITADNLRYRQCLTYFMQVFSYSSHDNQRILQEAVVPTLLQLIKIHRSTNDGATMITPLQAAQQLVDWTDPRILQTALAKVQCHLPPIDEGLQANIAIEALKVGLDATPGTRKVLIQFTNRLYVNEAAGEARLKVLVALIIAYKELEVITDAVSRNALTRFENTVFKALMVLELLSPDVMWDQDVVRGFPETQEIYRFIDPLTQKLSLLKPKLVQRKQPPPPSPYPSKSVIDPNFVPAKRRGETTSKVIIKVEQLQRDIDAMLLDSDDNADGGL